MEKKEYDRLRYLKKKEEIKQRSRERHHRIKDDPEFKAKRSEAARKRYDKDKAARNRKAWRAANPGKTNALTAKRRAARLQATPDWLTDEQHWVIQEIYDLCVLRSDLTGVAHHVDHIVPLQGKTVCGLHVPWNLQVITATENCSKGNQWLT